MNRQTNKKLLITTQAANCQVMNSLLSRHLSSSKTDRDICAESCLVFKIVKTSNGPITLEDLHQKLKIKGALLDKQSGTLIPSHVNYLISYLRYEDFLTGGDSGLTLGKRGAVFLSSPSKLWLSIKDLMKSELRLTLRLRLEALNLKLGEEYKLPAFRIMSEIVIKQLVKIRPQTLEELKNLPNFGRFKAERFGEVILQVLNKK